MSSIDIFWGEENDWMERLGGVVNLSSTSSEIIHGVRRTIQYEVRSKQNAPISYGEKHQE